MDYIRSDLNTSDPKHLSTRLALALRIFPTLSLSVYDDEPSTQDMDSAFGGPLLLDESIGEETHHFRTKLLCHSRQLCAVVLTSVCLTFACGQNNTPSSLDAVEIDAGTETAIRSITLVPGQSLGPVTVGMSYRELVEELGDPDRNFGFRRTTNVTYFDLRLEVLVATKADLTLSDDSKVISVGTLPGALIEGPINIGQSEDEAVTQFGIPTVNSGLIRYYSDVGMAIKLTDEGTIERVSVWPAFTPQVNPPDMLPAGSANEPTPPSPTGENLPMFDFEGVQYEVVDAHLHTGFIDSQLPEGMAYLVSQIPETARMFFPASSPQVLDPYDPYQGIKAHLSSAGVAHGVLLATYTQHTVGYASNRELEEKLTDERNIASDGRPWAWGLASVNYDDFEDPNTAAERLAALGSYFEAHPNRFIGIKLAHAHQAVGFDDPIYLGVYDVATTYQVPVLLHTGFSPFPNTMIEPEYYDPGTLRAVIEAYDGQHGQGRVDFVLSHIGQGDARAIEHSLELAERYSNVWLELSAINRPLFIDAQGEPTDDPTPMHVEVLRSIKDRGLIDRLIFATDGPQYFGKVHTYLKLIAETMRDLGYTQEEMQAVFAENFYRCFDLQ